MPSTTPLASRTPSRRSRCRSGRAPSTSGLNRSRAQELEAQKRRSSEVEQAARTFQALRDRGTYRAVNLAVEGDTHEGFVKFRDTGGVDILTLDRNRDLRHRDSPCLEHLYFRQEESFRSALFTALRNEESLPRDLPNVVPSTEAMIDCLLQADIPVHEVASWLKRHANPVLVPIKPEMPADPWQALTSDEVMHALESFTGPSDSPLYELPARGPALRGWIRLQPTWAGLLLVNDAYTRKAGEPRAQILFWPDLEKLRSDLLRGFGHLAGYPQSAGDEQPPSLESQLAFVQSTEVELESFHTWALEHTGPVIMLPRPSTVPTPGPRVEQHLADRRAERPLSLLPVRPRRLVERIDAPLEDVLASTELLRNVDEGDEAWIEFGADSIRARAKFEPVRKRIDVDIAGFEDGMAIYLSADGCRVVDITADRELPISDLSRLAQAGLLDARFAASAQEPVVRPLNKPSVGPRGTPLLLDTLMQWQITNPSRREAHIG